MPSIEDSEWGEGGRDHGGFVGCLLALLGCAVFWLLVYFGAMWVRG